jgi:hypothetical protein
MFPIILFIISSIIIVIIIIISIFAKNKEKFNSSTNFIVNSFPLDTSPIEKQIQEKPSIWDYYPNKNSYLMDLVASGQNIKYPPKGIYCDRPSRNRGFLINPIITQKSLFVNPKKVSSNTLSGIWANSVYDVHPELKFQKDPVEDAIGENIFYSNFHDTLNKIKNGKIILNDYETKCGLNDKVKFGTLNVPY